MSQIPTPEQLLGECEDLLRTIPPSPTFHHPTPENFAWLGRAAAVIERWDPTRGAVFAHHVASLHSYLGNQSVAGEHAITFMLNQARSDLRLRTVGPTDIAVGKGHVFHYFDEVRKVIDLATRDVFFVDPYLDAEFVTRYLPHIRAGLPIRLLTSLKQIATLLPAVETFVEQQGGAVSIRTTPAIHDRHVIIDTTSCYQSGSSFKDGAKRAPTTLTQITDAFDAVLQTYERLWFAGQVHR